MAVIFNRHSRRWWRPQFGLRGMFLLLTAFGIWLGVYVHRARQRQAAVQAIQAVEAAVLYDYQKTAVGYDSGIPSSLPAWLRTSLGDDFFYDVECADFFVFRWSTANDVDLPDASWAAIMPRLPALTKLRCLAVKSAKEMSDRSARYIGDLPHLETLTMEDAHHVTDETVSLFGRLKLTSLELTNSRITDESLRTIGKLPHGRTSKEPGPPSAEREGYEKASAAGAEEALPPSVVERNSFRFVVSRFERNEFRSTSSQTT